MNELLLWALLASVRLTPFLLVSPWLEPLARTLRTPLLLLFGVFSFSLPKSQLPGTLEVWGALIAGEFLLGCTLALTFALPFYAFRWLGELTEALRGAPRSQLPGAQAGSALSFFYHLAALAVFATMGGFVLTLGALHEFSRRYPMGQPWHKDALALDGALVLLADAFTLMIQVGAPVLVTAFLLEVALALIARTAPQIPVFFLALPARSLAILTVAGIGLGTTLVVAADVIGQALTLP